MASKPITILIVEGNDIDRQGIKAILQKEIKASITEARDTAELFWHITEHPPTLVLLGIDSTSTDMQKTLQQLFSVEPVLSVLVLSSLKEEIYGKNFLMLGASGFLQKNSGPEELVKAVNLILSGNLYMRKEVQAMYLGGNQNNLASPIYSTLTKKELEVLKYLLAGGTVYGIARMLKLSPSTIATHKAHILAKMNVVNMLQLTEIASRFPIPIAKK